MRRLSGLMYGLALLVALGVAACSDDTTPTVEPDKGGPDVSVDLGGDSGEDRDKGPEQDLEQDQGRDTTPGPDVGVDQGTDVGEDQGADQGVDQAGADKGTDVQVPPTGAGRCATAPTVTLTAGTVVINDDTNNYTNEFSSLKCRTSISSTTSMGGPQAYYRFQATQDQWYRFVLEPTHKTPSFYVYVFSSTSCAEADIQTDCQSEGATGASQRHYADGDDPRVVYYKAKANGMLTVAVDSSNASVTDGTFKLTITAVTTPTNATCATAAQISFFNGKGLVTGDVHELMTPDEFPNVICSGSTKMDGGQAYFKFDATAGKAYEMKLTNHAGYDLNAYVFGSSCSEADITNDCSSDGVTGAYLSTAVSGPDTGTLLFTPPITGTYTIAVDGSDVYSWGYFTIELEEITIATNGKCTTAEALSFLNGKAVVSSSTLGLTNEFGTSIDCTGSTDFDGPQAYYSFTAQAGKFYDFAITPTFSGRAYIFPDSAGCGTGSTPNINAACGSEGDTGTYTTSNISANATEQFVFKPTTAGKYVVVIDSTAPTIYGDFAMTVEEKDAPTNDTCAAATPLSFTAGKATVTGTNKGAANEHGTSIDCTGSSDFVGPQVYYSFNALANKGYKISFAPTFSAQLYIFSQSRCGGPTSGINADCGSEGISGARLATSSGGTILFKPATPGPFLIAVDSTSQSNIGEFTLTVEELDPPANQACSAATPITLTGGKATVTGTTAFGADEFPGVVNCGKSSAFDGPQAYYSFNATAGNNYWVQLTSTFDNAYLYVFGASCNGADIQTACSSGTTGAVLGPVSKGQEAMYITAPASGTFIVAVDSDLSSSNDEFGDFTIKVEEFGAATNATCQTAEQITLVNNAAQVTGYTVGSADEFTGAIKCGGTDAFAAGQVYYKADLVAGQEYTIAVSTDFAAKAYFFRGAAGCQATGIEADCASTTGTDGGVISISAGKTGRVTFSPTTSQTYYIAIDGATAQDTGRYQIDVSAFVIPTLVVPASGLTLDFESSNGGLASKGDWQWGQLAWAGGSCGTPPPNNQGHVPTQTGMWGVVLNDCYPNTGNDQPFGTCTNTDPSDDDILAFNLDLSACSASSAVTLKVWHYNDTSSNANYDRGLYYVDGVIDTGVSLCSGDTNGWKQISIDLSAHKGNTVKIGLNWMASAGANGAGWYIDEIEVVCQ